jgi:hypothetical protein
MDLGGGTEPRGSGRCLLVFGRQRRQRSKRHRPRQPLGGCHVLCLLPRVAQSAGVWSGRAAASARRIARGTRRGSTPPSRPSRRALRSRRLSRDRRRVPRPSAAPGRVPGSPQPPHKLRPSLRLGPRGGSAIPLPLVALRLRSLRSLRPGPQGPALAGTARLGFVYSAARSPTHFVPLPARTLPASLRLEGCAPAVTDRCGGAALRCPRRHEPLRLAPCVPRLRRCTAAASRRSLGLAVAPGLAPGANPAKPRAAMKRRNARRRSMKG